MKDVSKITGIISDGIELLICNQDGKVTLSQSKNVFKSWIDPSLKEFGLDTPSQSTEKINVLVYSVINGGAFFQIFKDINQDLDKSVLSMSQIIVFCMQHSGWLHPSGSVTLFLTKERINFFLKVWYRIMKFIFNKKFIKNYFVLRVQSSSDGLRIGVYRLKNDIVGVWGGDDRYCVVSPQTII